MRIKELVVVKFGEIQRARIEGKQIDMIALTSVTVPEYLNALWWHHGGFARLP